MKLETLNGMIVSQSAIINMRPFGKERPRVTSNGVYMNRNYKRQRALVRRQFGPIQVEGLLKLTVIAVRPMPINWSESKRRMMRGEPAKPSPDLDNIVGAVMDALFPRNDDHIVSLEAHKIWGDEGQLVIKIEKMGD